MGPSATPGSSVFTTSPGPRVPSAATILLGGLQLWGESVPLPTPTPAAGLRVCTGRGLLAEPPLLRWGLLQAPLAFVWLSPSWTYSPQLKPALRRRWSRGGPRNGTLGDTVAKGAVGPALAAPPTLSERHGIFTRVLGHFGVSPLICQPRGALSLSRAFSPRPQPVRWLCPCVQGLASHVSSPFLEIMFLLKRRVNVPITAQRRTSRCLDCPLVAAEWPGWSASLSAQKGHDLACRLQPLGCPLLCGRVRCRPRHTVPRRSLCWDQTPI